MNIKDIITFFDKHAPSWDSGLKINEKIIDEILRIAQIQSGDSVLDIACGTGVLFPFYLFDVFKVDYYVLFGLYD